MHLQFAKILSCYVKASALNPRKCKKLLVRLNGVGHELTVPEQRVGSHRGGEILGGFPVRDLDSFQGNAVCRSRLRHPGHPITGKGTLICVIENEAALPDLRMPGAFLELWLFCRRFQRQVHEGDPAVRGVRDGEALVGQIPGIGKKLPLPSLRGKNADPLPPLSPGVPDALAQQVGGIPMPLHGAGDPQAVDVKIPRRVNGNPGVLRRNVLDEALPPFLAPVENQPLREPLLEPCLFPDALLARHGAADVFGVDVFVGDSDVTHTVSPFCDSLMSEV